MNTKLIIALSLLSGFLTIILIGEGWYAQHTRTLLLLGNNSGPVKQTLDEMPSLNLTEKPEQSYVDLVSRPIFMKGRRPVKEVKLTTNQMSAAAAAAAAANFDWVLIGIYTSEKGLHALFVRNAKKVPKDNYRKITLGDELDSWKLIKIDSDNVTLDLEGTEKVLPLRKPKPKRPSAPESEQPVPVDQQPPPPEEVMPEQIPEPIQEPIPEPE